MKQENNSMELTGFAAVVGVHDVGVAVVLIGVCCCMVAVVGVGVCGC